MPRLRTTSGLSLFALLAAVTATAWLTELTYGPVNSPVNVVRVSTPQPMQTHRVRKPVATRWYPVQRVIDPPSVVPPSENP